MVIYSKILYVFKANFRICYMQDNNILTKTQQAVIDELFAEILEAPVYGIVAVSKELPKVAEIIVEEMQLMFGVSISERDVVDYLQAIPKD